MVTFETALVLSFHDGNNCAEFWRQCPSVSGHHQGPYPFSPRVSSLEPYNQWVYRKMRVCVLSVIFVLLHFYVVYITVYAQ